MTATCAAGAEPFPVHWIAALAAEGRRPRARRGSRSRGAPRAPTSSTRPACSARSCARVRGRSHAPYVLKLTADPAFERARRRGLVGGDVEAFQRGGGGLDASRCCDVARDATLRARGARASARARTCASSRSRGASRPSVSRCCRTRRRRSPALPPREELRASFGIAGRRSRSPAGSTAQKSLDVALEAVARVDGVALADRRRGRRRARARGELGRQRVGSSGRCRASACSSCSRAADASISRRSGRTSRTRWSRRSRSARR